MLNVHKKGKLILPVEVFILLANPITLLKSSNPFSNFTLPRNKILKSIADVDTWNSKVSSQL